MRTQSNEEARHFVTDDYSRWCEIKFLKSKGEVINAFKEYKSMVEKQTGKRIKFVQSDNGTEYRNCEFDDFLSGIKRQLTVPYASEQNGIAERKNSVQSEMFVNRFGPSK